MKRDLYRNFVVAVYISVPLHIALYFVSSLMTESLRDILGIIYFPSATIIVLLSKNVHSIPVLLDFLVTFVQTLLMLFVITSMVRYMQLKKVDRSQTTSNKE